MRRFGVPVLPLIIGVILGPRVEEEMRKTLLLSSGDWSGLVSEPTAIIVYAIIALGAIGLAVAGAIRGCKDTTTEVSA
jgi:putative tricarboxylic transport membrane protein